MSYPLTVTILGCGSSAGVPLIGCRCDVCLSDDPRNRRSRASILVESANTRLLIDTSPDLRQHCLREDITTVDAVLYTHAHADHVHGIDDLRSLNHHRGAAIPAYMDAVTSEELQRRFAYAFRTPVPGQPFFRPALLAADLIVGQETTIGDITFTPFRQHHGSVDSLGFRFGAFAYSTDVKEFPPESVRYLEGLDYWIVDCLREGEAPTHSHRPLSLDWISRYGPKRAFLTHMSHEFDFASFDAALPPHVSPAFDGQRFIVSR